MNKLQTKQIRMILSDVDGVLTDGTLYYDHSGNIGKGFSTLDGYGISAWLKSGFEFGIVTGRDDPCVACRAKDLHIGIYHAGITDKRTTVENIAKEFGLPLEQMAFIGDDLPDLPALQICGFAAAVSNATEAVKQIADYITVRSGGTGAVRELIDLLLLQCER
ncbi:MAG: HAD hydrolase family protein [Planctomycetaceae bacterium]|jgi:3-deoxy-D-manno-octulosonate 8-phosphate phosphatase (KDO 8-P phosphatase)|nr:HAD hydrolase family protein [Planctomycetaceae bacterium]